jgi:hypothetical protein
MKISAASRVCLELTLEVLWKVEEAKERLAGEMLVLGIFQAKHDKDQIF